MPIKNQKITPLFAEPYFRADISDAISDEQVAFIKDLRMERNQSNMISENLYIFNEPELQSIKEAAQEALDIYGSEVLGLSQKLYITQSWSLINPPNVGMHGHSHSNSLVSGSLYFCDLPSPVAGMLFDRHRTYQQLDLMPQPDKRNIYNTPMNLVKPEKGEIILFSSSLQHLVEVNTSAELRHSIAFNSFIKGKLGNYRDVSELELT